MPQVIVIQQKDEDDFSFGEMFSFFLRLVLLGLIVAAIMVGLKDPRSPLKEVIPPESVPDVPFLPDLKPVEEEKHGMSTTAKVLIGIFVAIAVIAGYLWRYEKQFVVDMYENKPVRGVSRRTVVLNDFIDNVSEKFNKFMDWIWPVSKVEEEEDAEKT